MVMMKKSEVKINLYKMIDAFEKKDRKNYPHMAIGSLVSMLSDALVNVPEPEQEILLRVVDAMTKEALEEAS